MSNKYERRMREWAGKCVRVCVWRTMHATSHSWMPHLCVWCNGTVIMSAHRADVCTPDRFSLIDKNGKLFIIVDNVGATIKLWLDFCYIALCPSHVAACRATRNCSISILISHLKNGNRQPNRITANKYARQRLWSRYSILSCFLFWFICSKSKCLVIGEWPRRASAQCYDAMNRSNLFI